MARVAVPKANTQRDGPGADCLRDIVQTAFAAEDGDDRCPKYLEDLLREAAGLTGGEPEAMIVTASAKADDKYARLLGSVSYDELLCDRLIRAIIGAWRERQASKLGRCVECMTPSLTKCDFVTQNAHF